MSSAKCRAQMLLEVGHGREITGSGEEYVYIAATDLNMLNANGWLIALQGRLLRTSDPIGVNRCRRQRHGTIQGPPISAFTERLVAVQPPLSKSRTWFPTPLVF